MVDDIKNNKLWSLKELPKVSKTKTDQMVQK